MRVFRPIKDVSYQPAERTVDRHFRDSPGPPVDLLTPTVPSPTIESPTGRSELPQPVLDAARADLVSRQSTFLAKIVPLRDLIAYYDTQIHLCQSAIDAIDAILAAERAGIDISLGSPASKGS